MAHAAVGFLLQNLQQLLDYNEEIVGDAKDQVERLKENLILFKEFLQYSTKDRNDYRTIQAIVNNIRQVVDKAEDAIDNFVVQKAIYRVKNTLGKAKPVTDHVEAFRIIEKDIESIREKIKKTYGTKLLKMLPKKGTPAKKPLTVEEDNVVGLDKVAETLIRRLNRENVDLDIITIVGKSGLGKTTLARKIYSDQTIEFEFFTRAWVYVSRNYNKREVYISILSIIKRKTDYSKKSEEFIAKEVRKFLETGKYFIVLDDVWTRDAWDDLKNVFPDNKNGSRILITSPHKYLAQYANPINGTHELEPLTKAESWELLENKVFGKGKCSHGKLQTVGENIAAKCDGLPLDIAMIAGILLNNLEAIKWWKQVSSRVNSFNPDRKRMDIIALSYNHLPHHLKSCFLYVGVFPKDYEIPAMKLTRLWISEGFIEHEEDVSLEGIAEIYLTELVNRNFLMVSKRKSNGHIKTCHVHDELHDFCKKEAARQNFYVEIETSAKTTSTLCRRVAIHSNVVAYITSKPHGQHVRSLLSYPHDEITLRPDHILMITKAFELLRVLDIKAIIFIIFPDDLLQLALLSYLALSCNIKALPESISQLLNMQTLIFSTTCPTLELNEEIWKMYQLRHLQTNASALLPSPPSSTQKGKENVQSLSMISPESCTKDVFDRTPNITKLGVLGKVDILFEKLFDNVTNLQHLTNFKLYNDDATFEGKVLSLPPANKFPKMLTKLTLSNTLLDWGQMRILEKLEKLEVLKLKENAFKGEIWEPEDAGFLSLKLLHIGRTNLVTWRASQRHFPSLKRLVLQHCENLVEVPSGFVDIGSFQSLELYYTNPRAAPSARKIQHIKMLKSVKATKTRGAFKLFIYPPDM